LLVFAPAPELLILSGVLLGFQNIVSIVLLASIRAARALLIFAYEGGVVHACVCVTSRILFNHPQGIHDNRFWAVALAVYASEEASPPPSKPIAKIV
jgi:hypothetical protein